MWRCARYTDEFWVRRELAVWAAPEQQWSGAGWEMTRCSNFKKKIPLTALSKITPLALPSRSHFATLICSDTNFSQPGQEFNVAFIVYLGVASSQAFLNQAFCTEVFSYHYMSLMYCNGHSSVSLSLLFNVVILCPVAFFWSILSSLRYLTFKVRLQVIATMVAQLHKTWLTFGLFLEKYNYLVGFWKWLVLKLGAFSALSLVNTIINHSWSYLATEGIINLKD